MSSTRHVEMGERRRQNGWASAVEFESLRGLNGTAVAMKAALLETSEARELLYFIQLLSLCEGGLKRIAREVVEMFPERIGTPYMHKFGCRPGKALSQEQSDLIEGELDPEFRINRERASRAEIARRSMGRDGDELRAPRAPRDPERFLKQCQDRADSLDESIEQICCDPHVKECPYFHDLRGALSEYMRRCVESAAADHVETSITRIVFDAMDYVLETRRSALIEGNSGFGKTTGLKAWCDLHPGQARYVQLSGMTTRGAFLKRVARACGVASGGGLSAERIQLRVEDFLRRTKLILVIDEGQYLWPQGRRITSHPELINWLNTALYNEGVPFVISATKQFTLRRQVVERQSDWSSEQLRRRTRKVFPLPDAPTTKDLQAVARKLVGDLGESAVNFVAGYAKSSKGYFQSITDAIGDAQLIAKRAGRDRITFKDLTVSIYEWRAPSDAALQRVFDSKPEKPNLIDRPVALSDSQPPVETPPSLVLRPLQRDCNQAAGQRQTAPAVLLTG